MADAKQAMNYEIYIQPHRLPEVRPRQDSADPDEQFFIRTHQAFEIWFAQALAELEHARTLLAQPAPRLRARIGYADNRATRATRGGDFHYAMV